MCSICTTRTSMTREAASIQPEAVICAECDHFWTKEMYRLVVRYDKGRCHCGHIMLDRRERIEAFIKPHLD